MRYKHAAANSRPRIPTQKEETMFGIAAPVAYLLASWVVVTVILVVLLIYAKTVSAEDNRFNGKRLEDERVVAEERAITEKLNRLKRRVIPLAVLSVVLLLATTAVWVWFGLKA
jgi:cell division septal protein FtsQ